MVESLLDWGNGANTAQNSVRAIEKLFWKYIILSLFLKHIYCLWVWKRWNLWMRRSMSVLLSEPVARFSPSDSHYFNLINNNPIIDMILWVYFQLFLDFLTLRVWGPKARTQCFFLVHKNVGESYCKIIDENEYQLKLI